ncbi:hypothetical protein TSAR_009760 [Trichomalopsis sarcophagae]|uniref:Uncharacterized protein n=1 Tax=Trichomalopsis sarcophagae TaxID=543379 RepID=A0A232EWH1_9HYME|nr:hypothetical protein TSAR_009760 [Trichomalopsis sarcophagae]
MFNSFLDVSILPDSRYLIDKLFYPDEGIQYHAVCPDCRNYVKEFTKENVQVRCDICEENINLKDPSYRDFFVVLNIENELKHLIENNKDYYMDVLNRAEAEA